MRALARLPRWCAGVPACGLGKSAVLPDFSAVLPENSASRPENFTSRQSGISLRRISARSGKGLFALALHAVFIVVVDDGLREEVAVDGVATAGTSTNKI